MRAILILRTFQTIDANDDMLVFVVEPELSKFFAYPGMVLLSYVFLLMLCSYRDAPGPTGPSLLRKMKCVFKEFTVKVTTHYGSH